MKKRLLIASMLVIVLLLSAMTVMTGCDSQSGTQTGSTAAGLAEQAKAEMQQGNLTRAAELYGQAEEAYDSEGDAAGARECLNAIQEMSMIEMTYPLTEEQLRQDLAAAFPGVGESEREEWIASGELEHLDIDGEPMYLSDVITNIKFRDVALFQQDPKLLAGYEHGYNLLKETADIPIDPSWQPFTEPLACQGAHVVNIPRDQLPAAGLLKIWFPLPLITGPQPAVRVTSIEPDTYVVGSPSIDGDIGLLYMEVPLDSLTGDLSLRVGFEFEHHAQRFAVDPAKVAAYDTESALYREYTESSTNIAITTEIVETARQVVGDETNPYLAAKKLYDYVLDNIKYSLMPHTALPALGIPESVYVHEHRYGDCGAQSIYFSALCRSVGIPARTTGGWQLFSGYFGNHFWAEFFLPGYGWVPVDPTVADMGDYIPGLSAEDLQAFQDLYFGSMDNLRCVIQHDVDDPFTPAATEPTFFSLAFQSPAINCDTMEDLPDLKFFEYCSLESEIVSQ